MQPFVARAILVATTLSQVWSVGRSLRTSRSTAAAQQSARLNHLLQQAAEQAPSETTKELLQSFRLCAKCNQFERFGERYDGGYVMCTDGLADNANHKLLAAYSFGVQGYDGWGMQVAERYHIPLFEYDCFNTKAPTPCEGCQAKFTAQCLGGNQVAAYDSSYKTLDQQLTANGHMQSNAGSILLKVDIEGSEWSVLPDTPISTLQKFQQIVIEFHGLRSEEHHADELRASKQLLDAGFVPVHLHGNNYAKMTHFGDYSIPNVLEVTYVQRPQGQDASCPTNLPEYLPQDNRNNFWNWELDNAVLPTA